MAISDILSDSACEIREWLESRPGAYADWRPRLEKLLSEMDSIRIELDTPPSAEEIRQSNRTARS